MSDIESKRLLPPTLRDAILFRDNVINVWTPQTDVWAFKYGDDILGSLSGFGSILITYIFRKELKLRPYARVTCYLPVVGIASMATYMCHNLLVSPNMLRLDKCSLCISTQASLLQVVCGVGYPLIASTLVCFHVADNLLTYPVPPLLKAPREVFHLFKKIIYKNPRPYLALGAMHVFAALFMTYEKQQSLLRLDMKTRS